MDMKKIMKGYREAIPEYDDRALQEVETREGFRNYKITVYVKIDKRLTLMCDRFLGRLERLRASLR